MASGIIGSNAEDSLPASVDPAKAADVQQWRDAVPIMCWVECGLFCVLVAAGLARACSCCRK